MNLNIFLLFLIIKITEFHHSTLNVFKILENAGEYLNNRFLHIHAICGIQCKAKTKLLLLLKFQVVRSTGRSECPICLGPPVAGRVGHCGHVYCWACILHYSAAHEKQPPPCPVCAMSLQVADMKPTRMVQWESPAEEVLIKKNL